MSYIMTRREPSSRTDHPFNPDRRHRASFAREAVIAAFGRHAFAIDQADFLDRLPGDLPRRAPGARF